MCSSFLEPFPSPPESRSESRADSKEENLLENWPKSGYTRYLCIDIKDILPHNAKFSKNFLLLCSPVNLSKHNIYAFFIIWKIEAVF